MILARSSSSILEICSDMLMPVQTLMTKMAICLFDLYR